MTPTAATLTSAMLAASTHAPIQLVDAPARPEGGRLPAEAISAVIASHPAELLGCVRGELGDAPAAVDTTIVLHVEGVAVAAAEVAGPTHRSRLVGLCVAASARGWTDLPEAAGWLDLHVVHDPALANGL